MIKNVGAFTRNTEFLLLPLWDKSVRATVPYSRPCFLVMCALHYYMCQDQHLIDKLTGNLKHLFKTCYYQIHGCVRVDTASSRVLQRLSS